MTELRVVDAGCVGPRRSQALWHGIAEAMREGDRPTLSLCRSRRPYVGLGYHHPLASLDLEHCRRRRLPILRRRIGGGAVWVDADQLLFQLTLPAAAAPARVSELYRRCLGPAVAAFAALGLPARLRGVNDISVGERKISGTGAGRIGDGVTVVGNVIFRFPHRRMVEVLDLGGDGLAGECLRLMRRHVSSLAAEGLGAVEPERPRRALVDAYADAFGAPLADRLTAAEERAIAGWEARLAAPDWLAGPPSPAAGGRRVKIAEGVWLAAAGDRELAFRAAIVNGRLERPVLTGSGRNGALAELERALDGAAARPAELARRLEPYGADGARLARLLAPSMVAA